MLGRHSPRMPIKLIASQRRRLVRPVARLVGSWCLLMAWLTPAPALAQDASAAGDTAAGDRERAWSLGLRAGVGLAQTLDRVVSPLAYHGLRIPLQLVFSYERGRDRHRAALGVDPSLQWNRFGHRALFFANTLEYTYAHALRDPDAGGVVLSLGGAISGRIDPAIYIDYSTDYMHWATLYALSAYAVASQRLSARSGLYAALRLPFFGFASRPPAERFDVGEVELGDIYTDTHDDLRPASFGNYVGFELRLCLRYLGRGPGSRELCYQLRADRFADPRPLSMIDHVLDYSFWF